jgi:hypothetical protein
MVTILQRGILRYRLLDRWLPSDSNVQQAMIRTIASIRCVFGAPDGAASRNQRPRGPLVETYKRCAIKQSHYPTAREFRNWPENPTAFLPAFRLRYHT